MAEVSEPIDFSSLKKTKKKGKKGENQNSEGTNNQQQEGKGELSYTYDFLLERLFKILQEKNPTLGTVNKIQMRPPQLAKIGTTKVAWINFKDNCESMKRPPEHVSSFFLVELATEGSVAGGEQLVIKGKYQNKQIEKVLIKYIKEFVSCNACKNADTNLIKDQATRSYIMECNVCHSSRSVAQIKSGYQAVKRGDRKKEKK